MRSVTSGSASFSWWTRQFEAAGFVRCGATELRMHPHLARFGMTKYWNLYALRTPDAKEPTADVRPAGDLAHWEENFGLTDKVAAADDQVRVDEALARQPRSADT